MQTVVSFHFHYFAPPPGQIQIQIQILRHVSQRVGLIVIPGCLDVCLSVGHPTAYSLPRLIDHNQIWYAGTYLSSHGCKPLWIPCLPYSLFQMEKYRKFRLFPTLNRCHLDIRIQIKKSRRESTRMSMDSIVPKY